MHYWQQAPPPPPPKKGAAQTAQVSKADMHLCCSHYAQTKPKQPLPTKKGADHTVQVPLGWSAPSLFTVGINQAKANP